MCRSASRSVTRACASSTRACSRFRQASRATLSHWRLASARLSRSPRSHRQPLCRRSLRQRHAYVPHRRRGTLTGERHGGISGPRRRSAEDLRLAYRAERNRPCAARLAASGAAKRCAGAQTSGFEAVLPLRSGSGPTLFCFHVGLRLAVQHSAALSRRALVSHRHSVARRQQSAQSGGTSRWGVRCASRYAA